MSCAFPRPLAKLLLLLGVLSLSIACGGKKSGGNESTPQVNHGKNFSSSCTEAGGKYKAAADGKEASCECGASTVALDRYVKDYASKDANGGTFRTFCSQKVTEKAAKQREALTAACDVLRRDCRALESRGARFLESGQIEQNACECGQRRIACGEFENESLFGENGAKFNASCVAGLDARAPGGTNGGDQGGVTETRIADLFRSSCEGQSGARFTRGQNANEDRCACGSWSMSYAEFRTGRDAAGYLADATGNAFRQACERGLRGTQPPSGPGGVIQPIELGSCRCQFELSNGSTGYHLCTLRDQNRALRMWIYQPRLDWGTRACNNGCQHLAIDARQTGVCR